MNWLKQLTTMDRYQKARLKQNLGMVFGNIGVQAVLAFVFLYVIMALFELA